MMLNNIPMSVHFVYSFASGGYTNCYCDALVCEGEGAILRLKQITQDTFKRTKRETFDRDS